MTDNQETGVVVRRAQMADRDELVRVLNIAFSGDPARPVSFLSILPHLFDPERISEHYVRVQNGRIVGAVGLYQYDVKVGGVVFRGSGLGQVATLPEARGGGVMTVLLKAACHDADAAGYEFCWLGGDRLRYGRFGWATGGLKMSFFTTPRFLPEPPPESEVRALDAQRDFDRVRECMRNDPNTVVVPDGELRKILKSDLTGGWVAGGAFVAYRRGQRTIYLGDGKPDEVARLLSHHSRWLRSQPQAANGDVVVECAAGPSALLTTCQKHYAGMSMHPSGMLRVGPLKAFLEKACQAAQPNVACGSGHVSLTNSETGEAATVVCANGRLSVEAGARETVYTLDRLGLSEVCFGLCPLDLHLPGLPQGSFLRRVLPLPAYWSRFFGV